MTSESVVGIAYPLSSEPSASVRASSSRKRGTPSARCTNASRTSSAAAAPSSGSRSSILRASSLFSRSNVSCASGCTCGIVRDFGPRAHGHQDGGAPPAMTCTASKVLGSAQCASSTTRSTGCRARPILDPGGGLLRRGGDPTHDLAERLQRAEGTTPAAQDGGDGVATRRHLASRTRGASATCRFPALPTTRMSRPGPPSAWLQCSWSHATASGRGTNPVSGRASRRCRALPPLQDAEGRHRMGDAFQRQRAERLQLEETRHQIGGVAADHDLARLPRRLQAGRHVGNLAPDIGQALLPSRGDGGNQHLARVDARPRLQVADAQFGREFPTQPHDVLDDGQARLEGVAARGLLGLGVAEIGDGPVALGTGRSPRRAP